MPFEPFIKKHLHPATSVSRNQTFALAREIVAHYPDYYGNVPLYYLALHIREFLRFCEDSDIWEPKDLAMIIQAMFRPAPSCLNKIDRDYAIRIITNIETQSEARARSISHALTGNAPPPRELSGYK